MGAGFSRLNSLTIIQTSQGLAEYLLSEQNGAAAAGVVIGYDARHNSRHFAELVAAVFIAKRIKVWWYEDLVHTPMVSFGVKHLKAAVGVMITASHNPAQDNGYKVYGPNGCQINTPVDEKIASSILRNLEPVTWDTEVAKSSPLRECISTKMTNLYTNALFEFTGGEPFFSEDKIPPFVYTPMHGVGLNPMKRAIDALENPERMSRRAPIRMVIVDEQAIPDPNFPTVRYPNPEEDGALHLAKSTADRHGIALVIANDPDADRLAIAEKVDGEWIQFTGDQIGVFLAQHLLSRQASSPHAGTLKEPSQGNSMLASAFSSQMLSHMAADAGVLFQETLTGFKWLGARALELEAQGHRCLFAYEEALGYMFPEVVRDKDGILGAAVFLVACSQCQSPWTELQSLYNKYGHYVTMNTYWRSPDLATTVRTFERIRVLGRPYPEHLAGRKVLRWRDLTTGYDSDTEGNRPHLPISSGTQIITCWLSGEEDEGTRFTVRASGTEPKIKCRPPAHTQKQNLQS